MARPSTVTDEQFREICRRLDRGDRPTDIAAALGVNRRSVYRIAAGEFTPFQPKQTRARAAEPPTLAHRGPKGRCPECGVLVYLPCVECKNRRLWDEQRRANRAS